MNLKKLISALFFISFYTMNAFAQTNLVAALSANIIPIKSIAPNGDFSDLQPLKPILKDKKLIGLGESAHGAGSFFLFKQRLLEFLVKEIGVKILFTETDFAGTTFANDYVLYGKGDLQTIRKNWATGVWATQEFMDMLEWLKQYNATQTDANRVQIFGFDMTRGNNAASLLKSYLQPGGHITPIIQKGFDVLTKGGKLTDDDLKAIDDAVNQLRNVPFDLADKNAAFYQYLIHVIEQYREFAGPNVTARENEKNDLRDKYMAQNIEWAYHFAGESKAVIWSHSEHLTKAMNSTNITRAGIYLDKTFKSDYYLLGLCFNNGTIKSTPTPNNTPGIYEIPPIKDDNNSDALFAQCNTPNFILDFKTASANAAIKDYLNQTITSYFIGSNYAAKAGTQQQYIQHKWGDGYDGIAFIRTVKAATAMK